MSGVPLIPVPLFRVADSQIVEAVLLAVSDKHLEDAKTFWEPLLQGTESEDEYWNWERKSRRAKMLPGGELYAIEFEGMTQGLMVLDVLKKRCQIESQFRQRLVYIEALATAPWNRSLVVNPPSYRGVGGALVHFAIQRSQALGYYGRIGLHALPNALNFYQKLGVRLIDCGPDPDQPDNLVYLETLRRNL